MAKKPKLVDKLPKCDFCGNPALCDAPTVHGTSWANMCCGCVEEHSTPGNIALGTIFKLREPKPEMKMEGIQLGIEETDLEELMLDGDRYVGCPACGDSRHVEPDAAYTFKCGCGTEVKCGEIM